MTIKILKVLVGLTGIIFLGMGLHLIFAPENLASEFAVVPEGIRGMSTLRADIGSFFLCMGIFSIAALRDRIYSPALLFCTALLVGVAGFGRFVGFVLDGIILETLLLFVVEIIFVAVYVGLAYLLTKHHPQP